MQVTGTLVNIYYICHRELWLHANGIRMEHTSDIVYEGKLTHETTYSQRSDKYRELEIGPIKIDYFDAKNSVVHEIKLSNKAEKAHQWQLKYYLYILEQAGIDASGVLEYPKLHKKEEYWLTDLDRAELETAGKHIKEIIAQKYPPPLEKKRICRSCSYQEFCFSGEE